jgi:hypothetical protein
MAERLLDFGDFGFIRKRIGRRDAKVLHISALTSAQTRAAVPFWRIFSAARGSGNDAGEEKHAGLLLGDGAKKG